MSIVFSVLASLHLVLSLLLATHVVLQLWLAKAYVFGGRANRRAIDPADARDLPSVTVQLPLYNERFVVERLLDRVVALRYPRDRIEIQVLDDSTDDTVALAAARIAHFRAQGVDIRHLRRRGREGFKAGALRHGLASARGDLIAVFDADFMPDPDFLLATVRHFSDPRIGMVQTRWSHANRDDGLLTQVQGLMLDTHLTVEQVGRSRLGCFINFNGTAGVWRAAAIRDAGNWSDATLTEDLDLSYRAQLRGWRFLYLDEIMASGELPDNMRGFRSQQFRWTKGGAQTAAHLLPLVLRSKLGWRAKLHACAHLLETSVYMVFLLLVLSTVPMAALEIEEIDVSWTIPLALFAMSMSALVFVYLAPCRAMVTSAAGTARFLCLWSAFIVVSTGLAVHNSLAAIGGWRRRGGEFVRTPKRGDASAGSWRATAYLPRGLDRTFLKEFVVWLYLLIGVAWSAGQGTLHLMLGPLIAFSGLSFTLAGCLGHALQHRGRAVEPAAAE